MKKRYKVGDLVEVKRRTKDGPKLGRYRLVRKMGGRGSWEAQHEAMSWTIQLCEDEFA